jgi:hypothetical protein
VDQTLSRGVSALRRDLFDRLAGEGRWHTALLADGTSVSDGMNLSSRLRKDHIA